jgi:hypothetical protein
MTATLVPSDFQALTEPLALDVNAAGTTVAVELQVDSVTSLPAHRLRAEPFSLILRGPATPFLPQGTYALRHPRLGPIELFLVPIGRDAQAARYEVTFN